VFDRDQRGEKARFGQRIDKLCRIIAHRIFRAPVFTGKRIAQAGYRAADIGKVLGVVRHYGTALLIAPVAEWLRVLVIPFRSDTQWVLG